MNKRRKDKDYAMAYIWSYPVGVPDIGSNSRLGLSSLSAKKKKKEEIRIRDVFLGE